MVVAAIKFDERRDQIASTYSLNKDSLGQAQTLKKRLFNGLPQLQEWWNFRTKTRLFISLFSA